MVGIDVEPGRGEARLELARRFVARDIGLTAAEKTAYLEKYHAQMRDLIKAFDELEVAIKADKTEDAQKLFKLKGGAGKK